MIFLTVKFRTTFAEPLTVMANRWMRKEKKEYNSNVAISVTFFSVKILRSWKQMEVSNGLSRLPYLCWNRLFSYHWNFLPFYDSTIIYLLVPQPPKEWVMKKSLFIGIEKNTLTSTNAFSEQPNRPLWG